MFKCEVRSDRFDSHPDANCSSPPGHICEVSPKNVDVRAIGYFGDIEEGPNEHSLHPCGRVLAASLAELGRRDEAHEAIQEVLKIEPGLSLSVLRKRVIYRDE
jgi:hypothetical protein